MQHRVYQRKIHTIDELKQRLIEVWCGLEQSTVDMAIDQWRKRLSLELVFVRRETASNIVFELIDCLDFVNFFVTFFVMLCLNFASHCFKGSHSHYCSFILLA